MHGVPVAGVQLVKRAASMPQIPLETQTVCMAIVTQRFTNEG